MGDALADYVSWKRVAAAQTTFAGNLALINHHIIDRLGDIPLDDLTGRHVKQFCMDVLETPPKRGNQRLGERRELASLTKVDLRNRKSTLNTLLSILRMAVRGAVGERRNRCGAGVEVHSQAAKRGTCTD